MQSEIQIEVVLLKKTRDVHFITTVNLFSVALLWFGLPLIWTRVHSRLVWISEVVLYFQNFNLEFQASVSSVLQLEVLVWKTLHLVVILFTKMEIIIGNMDRRVNHKELNLLVPVAASLLYVNNSVLILPEGDFSLWRFL
jgi:hypothetical protein